MMVILEAVSGPIAGRRIEVRAGSILRIGRTAKSDYAVGEDSYLSGQHFAVECDGVQTRVRDLGSSNGTFVNGDRVTEINVQEGDSVMAGGTTFTVHIDASAEAAAPASAPRTKTATMSYPGGAETRVGFAPPPEAASQWPGFSRPQSILLSNLYREGEAVFALLDAVRDSRIPAFLDASGEQFAFLDENVRASPYLVSLPPHARLLDVLVKDGWNHSWGFYFTAQAGFEEVWRHWRSFVTLRNDLGQALTFRFWDPRVLRATLPAMSPQEAADFIGPLARLVAEGDKPEMAVEYSLSARGVHQRPLVLM